jgi:hypothetical protein
VIWAFAGLILLTSRNAPMITKMKYAIVMPFENEQETTYKRLTNGFLRNANRVNIYHRPKQWQKLYGEFQYSIKRSILAYPILYCFKILP